MLLFVVTLFFVGGGWLIGKTIASFFPKDKPNSNSPTFITHVHETHNHLHIDKETLKEITGKQ